MGTQQMEVCHLLVHQLHIFNALAPFRVMNDLWSFDLNEKIWTWMGGSQQLNQPGVYGTLGARNSNNQPGARSEHAMVIDESKRVFYLFSGRGYAQAAGSFGFLNDLWSFSLTSKEWIWIGGSNSVNVISYYQKTRVSFYFVPTCPGGRYGSSMAVDVISQKLFIFGGLGLATSSSYGNNCIEYFSNYLTIYSKGHLNDLFAFDLQTKSWTFVGGNQTTNQPGLYGTRGVPSPNNWPGSRGFHGIAHDYQNQKIYLLAGFGCARSSTSGKLHSSVNYNN